MSEERKFKIISIPDEITLNKNNIYEFEIIPSDEFLTKEEYEGIPIRLVSLQKVEQQEKEIEKLNNIINRIDNFVDRTIEVIKQQPTGDDEWILERLNGIKYLIELKDSD